MTQVSESLATKEFVRDYDQPKNIESIHFGLFSDSQALSLGEFTVVNHELYQHPRHIPTPGGCLDRRLGVCDKNSLCHTCDLKLQDCPGHFGYLKLVLPVFHIGSFRAVVQILQVICKTCSRLLTSDEQRGPFLRRMRSPNLDIPGRYVLLRKLVTLCKKHACCCPHCGALNGSVKKVGMMKLIHEKYRDKGRNVAATAAFHSEFEEAIKFNKDLRAHLSRAQEDLNPVRVLTLFRRMIAEDIEALDMNPQHGHPERLLLTHLLVPPVPLRPSVAMESASGSNEDDLTMKLAEILHINRELGTMIEKGAATQIIMEAWDFLQMQCGIYMNSEMPGLPMGAAKGAKGKRIRGLCQRLKGKHGRFRGNLSGKRVDFTSRAVLSPDPNINVDEVGIPLLVARTLTFPERVTFRNIKRLQALVLNGPDVHPGANYVTYPDGGKRYLKFGNREHIAADLKPGYLVERHLVNGDIVLFNRQPSLHRVSIMAHKCLIMPSRTFRINTCVCAPYNADFDGDEMNLHVPQTEEARVEAAELMAVTRNMQTPRTGDILVSPSQDFLTASFLITNKDRFYNRGKFCQYCTFLCGDVPRLDIPPPAIYRPFELWTGKQLFQMLLRPNRQCPVKVNLETCSRMYSGEGLHFCRNDGYVCFRDSELLCGVLDKATLGGGSKDSLFHVLLRDFSSEIAADVMSRLARLCSRWIGDFGFSVGISDVQPSLLLSQKKQELVERGYDSCDKYIATFKQGNLQCQAGMNEEQTLEALVTNSLSDVREQVGKMCLSELDFHNSPLIMALCGAKGSNINISQMIACVGQQTVSGQRIPDGFIKRSLPHFPSESKIPAAKGFVKSSFFSGLSPNEFFFHTMGGREGLVDTAVKTAETGYMQRRLIKALEDLHVQYDRTVRNSLNGVVQFSYGEDDLDPVFMEAPSRPINFHHLFHCVLANRVCHDEPSLLPKEIISVVLESLNSPEFGVCSTTFLNELRAFFGVGQSTKEGSGIAMSLAKLRQQFGLNAELEDSTMCSSIVANGSGCELQFAVDKILHVTHSQLSEFFRLILKKYHRAIVHAGEAVGAVCAQSVGEPATQMTLKTFHFAGVASMNITLGVPRIREIINATKQISTPIITAQLITSDNLKSARIVKGRIETTTVGEIAEYIKEIFDPRGCCLSLKLDLNAINSLQLECTPLSVRQAILSTRSLKLREKHVVVRSSSKLVVYPPVITREHGWFCLQQLSSGLPRVVVSGIPGVSRAVINAKKMDGTTSYHLLVEGSDLAGVMVTPGVLGTETVCNHLIEVERVLGIEAARSTIIKEIYTVMNSYGINVDSRHVMLVADLMTYRGSVLGITRFGMSKMKNSILMLASFEKTVENLFDAAIHGRADWIRGPSERIILGLPIPLGTGLFQLLHRVRVLELPQRSTLLEPCLT